MTEFRWARPIKRTYFVRAVGIGLVKIGRTTNPDVSKYIHDNQTFCPVDLVLVGVIDDDETETQDRFEGYWDRGEWYHETGGLASYIAANFPETEWRAVPSLLRRGGLAYRELREAYDRFGGPAYLVD